MVLRRRSDANDLNMTDNNTAATTTAGPGNSSSSSNNKSNPWETETQSALVSIGTHRLWISASGPARPGPSSPVVIYITGGGAPAACHVRLQRQLSRHVRCYFYDRAGYDRSERGPQTTLTATGAAEELAALLAHTTGIDVGPPYVLVSHSYGSIIARTFVQQHASWVAGLALMDSGTELMYQLFAPRVDAALDVMRPGVDLEGATHLREESRLTDDEWEAAEAAIERTMPAARDEDNRGSARQLARWHQFESHALGEAGKPVSVLRTNMAGRDWQTIYDEGVKRGNGTDEERRAARTFIETWHLFHDSIVAVQMRLVHDQENWARYRYYEDTGHDVVIRRPEYIVKEVRWVYERLGCEWKDDEEERGVN